MAFQKVRKKERKIKKRKARRASFDRVFLIPVIFSGIVRCHLVLFLSGFLFQDFDKNHLPINWAMAHENGETLSRSWLQKAVITAWLQKCKNHTYSREDTHYDIPWLSSAIKRACLNGGAIPRSLACLLHSHDYRRNAVRLAIMRCSYVAVRTKEGGGWCALPLSVLLQMQR